MEDTERAAEKSQARQDQLAFERAQHELQQALEEEDRKRQLNFERELLSQKLQYQKDLDAAHPDTINQGAVAKLPKLSITKEGYQNAKVILEAEYGQTEEIGKAYRQNLANLPVISGSNTRKVQEFYKKNYCIMFRVLRLLEKSAK